MKRLLFWLVYFSAICLMFHFYHFPLFRKLFLFKIRFTVLYFFFRARLERKLLPSSRQKLPKITRVSLFPAPTESRNNAVILWKRLQANLDDDKRRFHSLFFNCFAIWNALFYCLRKKSCPEVSNE